jgi:uncharacterized protein (TIGR02118 family)
MIIVSVTYPASEGTKFDLDYYRTKHIPLVRDRWAASGLSDIELLRGAGAPGGGPASFHMIALLSFESEEAFGRAAKQHGNEVMNDIKNFTDAKPAVQFNEKLS